MSYVEKYDNFEMKLLGMYNVNRCFGNMEICLVSTQQTSAAFSYKNIQGNRNVMKLVALEQPSVILEDH